MPVHLWYKGTALCFKWERPIHKTLYDLNDLCHRVRIPSGCTLPSVVVATGAQGRLTNLVLMWESLAYHFSMFLFQVLPYIDGFNHVAQIAVEADVKNNLVKACVQNFM